MKQMIVVTDGCSNAGLDPVLAASHVREEGITVHVIGVVDEGEIGERGAREIAEIAEAGGGLSRIVHARQLAQTMQLMTRQTVAHTIQQAVNRELKHVLGKESLEELPPGKRSEVVRVIDELSENEKLQVALLIDASASMKPKLHMVEEAIQDLLLSLSARTGTSDLAVFHFPGAKNEETAVLDVPWTNELANMKQLFRKMNMRGTTPTGPAILQVLQYMTGAGKGCDEIAAGYVPDMLPAVSGGGMWSEQIS